MENLPPSSGHASLKHDIQQMVAIALAEDLGPAGNTFGDITAKLIPVEKQARASIITREDCIIVGQAWVNEVFTQLDSYNNNNNHNHTHSSLIPAS